MKTDLKCPLCEETNVKLIEFRGTYIYICEDCPFVGFEDIDYLDCDNMISFLKDRKGIVVEND